MTALEKIFQGYYEERLNDDKPDPEGMAEQIGKILNALIQEHIKDSDSIMETVSLYGMEAEKTGFMAGFRMAWELLKNMQEGM